MACASMRWRRCCTATTRAARGSGFPTCYGGRENLEAIGFLRHFNAVVGERCAGAITMAEEFDRLARRVAADQRRRTGLRLQVEHGLDARHAPLHGGGSGQPVVAPQRHDVRPALCIRRELRAAAVARRGGVWKAFADRQDARRQLAALRQSAGYLGFMWGHPGKKLLFMGGEIAQEHEWSHDGELDWAGLEDPMRLGVQRLVRDLNRLYAERAGAAPARHGLHRLPLGGRRRPAEFGVRLPALWRRNRPAGAGRLQHDAGAAIRLRHRRAACRASGRNCSTPMRRSMVDPTWATAALCGPCRCNAMARRSRWN